MKKMKTKVLFLTLLLMSYLTLKGQVITSSPVFPLETDAVTITFHADQGNAALKDYTGDIYAHTGVITNLSTSTSSWRYVIAPWTTNLTKAKMTKVSANVYTLTISPSIREFYGVPAAETIDSMAFVFRNSTGTIVGRTATGGDIFYRVCKPSEFLLLLSTPSQRMSLVVPGQVVPVVAYASKADSMLLYDNTKRISKVTGTTLSSAINISGTGLHKILVKAWFNNDQLRDSVYYFVKTAVTVADVPAGMRPGVNITGDNTATFVLYAPGKNNVFVIGDFNDWLYTTDGYMKKSTDGKWFWTEISGLNPAEEYGFQYVIDGSITIPDPYATKILDQANDPYISATTYPNLKPYPIGLTSQLVSVFQTHPSVYQWKNTSFTPPEKDKLVVYELLVRDFVATHDFKTVMDTLNYLSSLGVNAIEFMPVNEFENNISWGYNPSMYFAVDKYYGPADSFKELIDSCHSRGMAVIMDMVLNHAYGSNPLVRMYFNTATSQVTSDNPWFNVVSPNPAYSWGYDFNHESTATQAFVDSVNHYWINEFKVDGFRFDFTKGFTNTVPAPGDDGSAYDASRINILERMGHKIWQYKPDAYLILEHFCVNSEQKVLSNYGFMLWGNCKFQYEEASMGFTSSFNDASYQYLGWNDPHIMDYMESHDEERIMYKNETWGNINGSYSVRDLNTGLKRAKLTGTFFFTIPGPKMIWQFEELGYDSTKTKHGNTGEMPILWNYYNVGARRDVYNNFAALIDLKKKYSTFSTTNYSLYEAGNLKRLTLVDADMDAQVFGNFDVTAGSITANFTRTGKWYEFFSGDSVTITSSNQSQLITLAAGEYRLYTSKRLKRPDFLSAVNNVKSSAEEGVPFTISPNPFSAYTTIRIQSDTYAERTAEIFSVQGTPVRVFHIPSDTFEQQWDGLGTDGKKVPPGLYIIRISTGGKYSYGKVILK